MRSLMKHVLLLGNQAAAPFAGDFDSIVTAAAFSTRKLYTAYAGHCVLLRRSSDNAEQAFGFNSSGDLDTTAITAWGGADTLYVKTLYDQSGNARDATQDTTTKQPTLELGVLNDRTIVRFAGGQALVTESAQFVSASDGTWSAFATAKHTSGTGSQQIINHDYGSAAGLRVAQMLRYNAGNVGSIAINTSANAFFSNEAAHGSAWHVLSAIRRAAEVQGYMDGTGGTATATTGTAQTTAYVIALGSYPVLTSGYLTGDIAEAIIITGAASEPTRQAIEASMDAYFVP